MSTTSNKSINKKGKPRSAVSGQFVISTVGKVGKEYKVNFKENPNLKISNYFRKTGIPSLGKALDKLEKGLPGH